jgi:hypothetical protein
VDQSQTVQENSYLQPTVVDPTQAREKAEQDINFLAMLALFEVMQFLFPPMFVVMWQLLKSKVHLTRDFSKIALGIPRAFAKTTFIKLWIVYCILFTRKSFIVVISYNEDHALSILSDVCKMLSSPNIITLFGNWELNQELDQASTKVFRFRGREIILKGVGAKGGIRGFNYGHKRPDLLIFEDYQKKAESMNEELSTELYKDMIGTAMKTKSPFGCLYLYVANMYPTPGSILKKLKNNSDWISLILGGIVVNKDTGEPESLWEELHPLTQLVAEYESDLKANCPEVFLAEVLNDETAGIKAGIDITKIPVFPFDSGELPQGRAVIIDPSLDNPTSDYNGIGLVGLYDGIPCLEKVKLKRFTPLELIKEALIMASQNGCQLICVENVAYQASLLFWFTQVCLDNGIQGFHFMALNVQGKSKNAKIMDALKELAKKEVWISNDVRPLLINEIIKFQPLKKNNQDTCLDLLTFCKKVVEQHRDLMYMPYEAEAQIIGIAAPRTEAENCSF